MRALVLILLVLVVAPASRGSVPRTATEPYVAVGGRFVLTSADGHVLVRGPFCAARDATFPAGGARLEVYVETALAPVDCALPYLAVGAPGTTGTVTVRFA